jgi:hypothetical protein
MNKYWLVSSIVFAKALTPTIGTAQTAATPTFSPAGGTYASCQSVTISDSTGGALIFYTTDGSAPNLASTPYAAPISVCSGETLKAIGVVAGVNQKNAQNNNPSSPGTFWKPADCATFSGSPPPGTNCTSDDPGGTGIPTSTTHTSGNASPSLSGASMLFAETAQVNKQTNVLWPVKSTFGSCDSCTNFYEDHWYYWPSPNNASSNEDDDYLFDATDVIRYMRGGQYCHQTSGCPGGTQGWDFWGNSNVPWTFTGVTAGGTAGVWHHFQKLSHLVPSERTTLPCVAAGNWPYLYVDALIIDGVTFNNGGGGWKACANADPTNSDGSHWGGTAMQSQIDIGSKSVSTSASAYWDNVNYMATHPLSSTATAVYVFSGLNPPVDLQGAVVVKGTATIQ